MGWVEKTFEDRLAYQRRVPEKWNEIRDSIGTAVEEFKYRIQDHQRSYVAQDCTAQGPLCRRVTRPTDGASIEVFFDAEKRELRTSLPNTEPITVCRYRLMDDRSGVELIRETLNGPEILTTEAACELALRDFMFDPFPQGGFNMAGLG